MNNNANYENHQNNLENVREILRNISTVHNLYLQELSNYNHHMIELLRTQLNNGNENINSNNNRNINTNTTTTGFSNRHNIPLRNAGRNTPFRINNRYRSLNTRIFENLGGFQNNRRILTIEEINNATETISYTEDLEEESCPISLETFGLNERICRIKECRHIFKRQPLMRWFQTNSLCPVCRYDLKNYNSQTQQGEAENNNQNNDDNETTRIFTTPPILNRNYPAQSLLDQHIETTLGTNLTEQISSVISEVLNDTNHYFDNSNNTITFEFPLYYSYF